jgi:hypothetical protein
MKLLSLILISIAGVATAMPMAFEETTVLTRRDPPPPAPPSSAKTSGSGGPPSGSSFVPVGLGSPAPGGANSQSPSF